MNQLINRLLKLTILAYAFFHFTTYFYPHNYLEWALSGIGFLLFILSCFHLRLHNFKLPLFIFISGIIILLYSNTNIIEGLHYGMIQMRSMVGLLIIMPLVGFVLREEPYIENIMALFQHVIHTSKRFYFSIVIFTQIIAYFLLFGAIPMMHQFINVILKGHSSLAWENFKGTALLRGFALSTIWVVSIPSFIFAVETLGASLSITIMQGLSIAFVGSILAVLFSHFQEKKYGEDLTPALQVAIEKSVTEASPLHVRKKQVLEFIFLFISLFGTVFLLHAFFDVPLMILIPLVIILWVFIFYIFKRPYQKIKQTISEYYHHTLTRQAYQLNMMLTVGVLIYALNKTNFSTNTVKGLSYLQKTIPFVNILSLLPFIIIFLGFMGLGPLTVMVLVAGILESMSFPYPPELIVLAVTSGSVISILISPLIMPVIVLSASNGLSLFTNGFKFNWKYAISFYMLVQIYLQLAVYFEFFT